MTAVDFATAGQPSSAAPLNRVEMRGIVKRFPGVCALDHVNFAVRPGEIMGLVGENGAGKSTLMKILAGAYQLDEGQILVNGVPASLKTPAAALNLGIRVIYQEPDLVPVLTVKENIFLGRMPVRRGLLDLRTMSQKAAASLSELGFDIDPETLAGKLGVAQQQIVAIAKALSATVEVLVLDEPAAVIPEKDLVTLFGVLRLLASRGIAIIYISHRLKEVLEITDRVTVLKDGALVDVVPTVEASEQTLTSMMVGRAFKDIFPARIPSPGAEALRLEHVTTPDVNDVSFALRHGEIIGMYGLVGSGRTELARALFGTAKLKSGQIYVDGAPVKIHSPRDAIDLGIGFLTEDRKGEGLVLRNSVGTNITMASYRTISKRGLIDFQHESEIGKSYVESLRIKTPSLRTNAVALSGGNQQKVVLAKWLCTKARVLIFDEPTRGIDIGAKVEIYNLIANLAVQGVAVLMISSELHEILGMCDRTMVMHNRRIVGEVTRQAASEELLVRMAMGVENNGSN
jgi:ribose transport system ATP-binding protein